MYRNEKKYLKMLYGKSSYKKMSPFRGRCQFFLSPSPASEGPRVFFAGRQKLWLGAEGG